MARHLARRLAHNRSRSRRANPCLSRTTCARQPAGRTYTSRASLSRTDDYTCSETIATARRSPKRSSAGIQKDPQEQEDTWRMESLLRPFGNRLQQRPCRVGAHGHGETSRTSLCDVATSWAEVRETE